MSIANLIIDLRRRGVVPSLATNGKAVFTGSVGALTEDHKKALTDHRDEVHAILRAEAGSPPVLDVAFWRAVYADIETWPDEFRTVFWDRASKLERVGASRDDAEARAFLELHEPVRAPSPALWLRDRYRLPPRDFERVCRRLIGRAGPSSLAEDAKVSAAILADYGTAGGAS